MYIDVFVYGILCDTMYTHICICIYDCRIMYVMIEGSLEVKLPTKWTDEKQRREEAEKRREEDQKRESLRRKKIQVREKVGKSRNTVFFQ